MNNFRIFVASSLRGEFSKYRQIIRNSIESLNNDPQLMHLNMQFESFLFEEDYTNTASTSLIQNDINLEIEDSHGFVLLCDSNIGKKTVEEARKALIRFSEHQPPVFILVLKRKGNFPISDNQVSYSDFHRDYIKKYAYTEDGGVDDDALLYEYEFDTIEDAADKLCKDVRRWLTSSKHRPLFKAHLGKDVMPEYLYKKDTNRMQKCNERIYFRRHFDNVLDQAMIADEPVILINGASLSGKTRALYQAIKNLPDAWFYKFVDRQEERLINEINDIADHIESSRSEYPLYLIFDDVHQLPSSGKIVLAAERLRDAIDGKKNIHIVMTSTSSDESFLIPDKIIKIKSLSKKEYHEAELFFRRYGLTTESGYNEIGAMMIDLESLKKTYSDFVGKSKDDLVIAAARRCTLNAVKASSIWHSSNLGNVESLYDFALHLLLKERAELSESSARNLIYDSMTEFIKLPGISKDENVEEFEISMTMSLPHYIQIEEYIYKYVLEKNSVIKEWDLVNTILSYVQEKSVEPLIVCLSKLARRAENMNEIATYIYGLVMEIYDGKEDSSLAGTLGGLKSKQWYPLLVNEIEKVRNEVAGNQKVENDECSESCIYLAKIIWARMLFITSYEEAERIYVNLPYSLQSTPMLGALIDKSAGNHLKINKVIREKGLENSYYIIHKLIKGCTAFKEAYAYFSKGKLDFTLGEYRWAAKELKYLQENGVKKSDASAQLKIIDIHRQHYVSALNCLAGKVSCMDDLRKVLGIIRANFLLLHDNLDLECDAKKLTMVDLLSRLSLYGLRGAFTDIMTWGEHIPDDLNSLMDTLIEEYIKTTKLYTPGYKAKQTISIIFNVFIDKCCNCHYKDVKENIFMKMQIQSGKKTVNFRDSYTYSSMMKIRWKSESSRRMPVDGSCKYIDALDLYYNYIEPAAKDPDGHFRVTRFILNEILNKVRSASEYEKLNRLYEKNNVVKDIYSYNNSLRNLSYSVCVKQILPQMCKNNVDFDIYTLGMLIQNAPNVKVASSYLYPLSRAGILSESHMVTDKDVKEKVDAMIRNFTAELPIVHQHFLWAALMETQCRDEKDRQHLFKVLEYLEKNVSADDEFWKSDKGIIYNNCLKNRSFIRNYDEAKRFIESKEIKPDVYTMGHLLRIIINDYKGSSDKITEHINDLYSKNKELIAKEIKDNNTHIYNDRLKAYKSQSDRLEMLFIFPDGNEKTAVLTPFEYVKYMADNGLPFDEYTLKTFCDIENGYTFRLFNELIDFIKVHGFVLTRDTIINIAKKFISVVSDAQRTDFHHKLLELPARDGLIGKGKSVVNMFEYGLYTIEEAFAEVDGNDTEKLYCYTQILSLFRRATHYQKDKSKLFRRCMDLYNKYIVDANLKVNVDLLTNLANLVQSRSELNEVFAEMKKANLTPVAYFLPSMMRVAANMDEVKELIGIYRSMRAPMLGREGSEHEVDLIVRGLSIIWGRTKNLADKLQIQKLFTSFGEYVLSDATGSDILADFPCFKIYKSTDGKSDRLTQQVLCELLKCWPYCADQDNVKAIYIERTVALLERFYNPENDTTRGYLASALISAGIKALNIDQSEMFRLLSPYPKLAFTVAEKFYNVKYNKLHLRSYDIYKNLVEIWNNGFDSIPEDKAIEVLVNLLCGNNLSECRRIILPGISKKWRSELTTADFILPDDSLSAEPQNVSNHRENQVLAKACLNNSWAISPVSSRCEFLLNLYAEREGFEAEDMTALSGKLDGVFEELINALGSTRAEDIPMLSVMNIFNVLIKNSIMVPLDYAQPLVLSLVNFYKVQLNNEKLGAFYRKHATDVLNSISRFCDKNSIERKRTKVYYAMFSNRINARQLYFVCDTNALKRALDKKI